MNQPLKLEVNIALLPESRLAQKLIAVSHDIASRYNAIVRLGSADVRLSLVPHLTLYQAAFPLEKAMALDEALSKIASNEQAHDLVSTGLAYNDQEGSLEDRKEVTDVLVALQERVIAATNPLREGLLLEHDPAGNKVADLLNAPGRLGENIRSTGYGEVGDPRTGGLFRPHDTLNWLKPDTHVDVQREQGLLDTVDMSGSYTAIGLFIMGPYGTCPQLLRRYELSPKSSSTFPS